jgi:hypothetical protein
MTVGKFLPCKVEAKQMKTLHAQYYSAAYPSHFRIVKSAGMLQNN